jgi:PAS domain S-box-containing protein
LQTIECERLELNLEESEARYRELFENASDGIYIHDTEGYFLTVNSTALRELGCTREEIIGTHISKWLTPESFKYAQDTLIRYISGETVEQPIVLEIICKDGEHKWVEIRNRIIKEGDRITGIHGVARNITERRRLEQKLNEYHGELERYNRELETRVQERTAEVRESEERYRSLVEGVRDVVFTLSTDGRITSLNAAFEATTGWSRSEWIGKHFAAIIHPDDLAAAMENFQHVLRGELLKALELRILSKSGNSVLIGEFTATQFIKDGKVIGVLGIARDVTERKRAEKQIQDALREKEVLLKEVHHRVKNNMQIISSLLRLQAEVSKDENVIEMFKESQNRITLMSLVHEKLYLSQNLAKIDFNDYIRDVVNSLFESYVLNTGKIALNINVENISMGVDYAIPCGLIINELVTNSLKYAFSDGREGEIKITLRTTDGDMIELKVSDNGIGIPENLDFRKTESLGLHLVTVLVENQLHGEINLNRSAGTEFQIKFRETK